MVGLDPDMQSESPFELILLQGIEHYKEGLKPLKDFVKYREVINTLAQSLTLQRRQLVTTCEKLLSNIVESEEDLAILLQDPTSIAWKEQRLADQLQRRLQDSYTVYFDLVRNLEQVLTALAEKMGLDNQGQVGAFSTLWHSIRSDIVLASMGGLKITQAILEAI
ncbi:MAG: hypothetical protein Q9182_001592 [Xanthomendoza sp. 2 TL-2023]